jgi:ferredoxin
LQYALEIFFGNPHLPKYMILTTEKDWSEIEKAIKELNIKSVVLVGCGECAAKCGTGGTEGVKRTAEKLQNMNIKVMGSMVLDEPCDKRIVKNSIKKLKAEIDAADAVMTLSCGVGAQTLAEITEKPLVVTTNTEFVAQTVRLDKYLDYCQGCGDCVLNETGGICPYTRCAKKMLNGPCGGPIDGKCEVGNYQYDCAWILIYNRLKKMNRLDLFLKYREPRDWRDANKKEVVLKR